MKTTALTALFAIALLSGCAADRYRNTPSAKLCTDYLSSPSINLNRGDREAELARRGENCAAYVGYASSQPQPVIIAPPVRTFVPAPVPKQVNCFSVRNGSNVSTTCN